MNASIKFSVFVLICTVIAVGCMTEQGRLAYEKEQLERIERERAEKAKTDLLACETAYKQRVEKYWTDLAEHNYNFIQAYLGSDVSKIACRRHGDKGVLFRFRKWDGEAPESLCDFVGTRFDLSKDEKMKGLALLEGFGTRYMPNAYANYEKSRESAEEIQQMFNESFPEPWAVKSSDPKWGAFCKLLKGLCKARGKSLRAHDELIHFYIAHKVGAATADDLSKIDQGKITIQLLEENGGAIDFPLLEHDELDSKTCDFAAKYTPEAYGVYTKLKHEREESTRLYVELQTDARLLDAVRFELAFIALSEKINFVTLTLEKLATDIRALYMDHTTMDKDADAIAKTDHKLAMHWNPFVKLLPSYIRDRANGPLIAVNAPMNTYYSNCDLLRWHWWALGFPDSPVDKKLKCDAKESLDLGYDITTGGTLDSLSVADCISDEVFSVYEIIEKHKGRLESQDGKKSVRAFPVKEDGRSGFVLEGTSFDHLFGGDRYERRRWRDKEDDRAKLRSCVSGVIKASRDAITTRYARQSWSYWSGTGAIIPIVPPFEKRLNEFNKGKCQCEIVAVKKEKKNGCPERWWKAVGK